MKNKHYDIEYLENSRVLLKGLKERSYNYFTEITEGTIVDLGCGAGKDVIELANLLGKNVKVIGVDHDPEMLAQAKASAGGNENVEFILSDAFPLPFKDESISGLRTERVIQHLSNPEEVIKAVHGFLKSDAPLVIIETDWHSLSFYTEFIETEQKINTYLTDVKVNNGYAARKLLSYLEINDFRDVKFEIHPFVIDSLNEANEYFWIEKIITEAAEKEYITWEEQADFYRILEQADSKGYFSCSINLVVASCKK